MTLRAVIRRLTKLFRKERLERELDEEIRSHLEMAAQEHMRRGLPPQEARREAYKRFGGVEQTKDECRWTTGIPWLERVLQDLRYGLRTLVRTPTSSGTALITLALGIGAATAVFSAVYAVLLRPLPYQEPERLVWITSIPLAARNQPEVAYHWDFVEWRERAESFSHVTAYMTGSRNFVDREGAERVQTAAVSAEFLATLGIRPLIGRDFLREEEEPGLAKCAVRRREMAIRGALGAGRARLARQLFTESALLAAGGCFAGIVLSIYLSQGLAALRPARLHHFDIGLNWSVLVFAVGISALTALAFGVLPALSASRAAPMATLRTGVTQVSRSRENRVLLNSLIAGQLSLALVLLIASGLMVETFQNLRFRNLGFQTAGVLTAYFSLGRSRYPEAHQRFAFFNEVLERAHLLSGVEAAALTSGLPPSGMAYCMTDLYAEGSTPPEEGTPTPCVLHQPVSATYFSALGIPLLQGEWFSGFETPSNYVAIVNDSFARAYFGTDDAIGKRFRGVGEGNPWRTVIGVVADTRNSGLRAAPEPHVYTPFQADTIASSFARTLIVVTDEDAGSVSAALRRLVQGIDPQQAMADIEPLDERLTREVSGERFLTSVLAAFAFLALTLAAIGIYGVVAYMVEQRKPEIGVRLALGADSADILRQVLGHGAKLVAAGAVLGLAGSLAATRVLEAQLFQVEPMDWRTFAFAFGILAAVAALACYWPARRASRTDPLGALRYD